MLLLDTHAWIWFIQGNEAIQKSSIKKIEAAIHERTLYLAAISQWELAMQLQKGRIILNEPSLQWMKKAVDDIHLKIIPLDIEIALESCQLPGDFHGDPADRMIVATARTHHLTLMTRDTKILNYSKSKHVKTLEI